MLTPCAPCSATLYSSLHSPLAFPACPSSTWPPPSSFPSLVFLYQLLHRFFSGNRCTIIHVCVLPGMICISSNASLAKSSSPFSIASCARLYQSSAVFCAEVILLSVTSATYPCHGGLPHLDQIPFVQISRFGPRFFPDPPRLLDPARSRRRRSRV